MNNIATANRINEIITLHGEILDLGRTALDKALRIGELLTGIKDEVKYGEWLPWVEENLPHISERSIQRYMSLYRRRDLLNTPSVADLTLTGACEIITQKRIEEMPICVDTDGDDIVEDVFGPDLDVENEFYPVDDAALVENEIAVEDEVNNPTNVVIEHDNAAVIDADVVDAVDKKKGPVRKTYNPTVKRMAPLIEIVDDIIKMMDVHTLVLIPQSMVLGKLRELLTELNKF